MSERDDITRLIRAVDGGDSEASDRLLQVVYAELRRLAQSVMRNERPGHTLQPTALVHEVYLKLFEDRSQFASRAHFFGAVGEAMRRILVDHARGKLRQKRGAGAERVTFDELALQASNPPDMDVLALSQALDALDDEHPRLGRIVRLRYFVGMSIEEAAEALGIGSATVKRDWAYARAWLRVKMGE